MQPTSSEVFNQYLMLNKAKTNIDYIQEFLQTQYDYRYNVVTARTEYKRKDDETFTDLTEMAANSMYLATQRNLIQCRESVFFRILKSDFVPVFDPFESYFSGLSWDGQDYITALANTVQTENQELWTRLLRKWLVAVVAGAVSKNHNDTVLVLYGKQRAGKTTWLENLLPNRLTGYMYTGSINPHSNDTWTHLYETLFINLDELENLNHFEQGHIKHIISKKTIRQRRPYERFHSTYQRRASFMGSTNDGEFLTDITGNRRYLCFTVQEDIVDTNVDMDKVFAQAYHLFKNGENGQAFNFRFNREEDQELRLHNDKYCLLSREEELILKYFEVQSEALTESFLTPTEIGNYINYYEGTPGAAISLKRVGQVMQKHGFRKKSTSKQKPYRLFKKPVPRRSYLRNQLESFEEQER